MSTRSLQSNFAMLLILLTSTLHAQPASHFATTPLTFEANTGQSAPQVDYLSRGAGYTVFLQPTQAVIRLQANGEPQSLRVQLEGARAVKAEPEAPQQTQTNYLIGSLPALWHLGVQNFGQVRYRSVWPGVDIVYYGNQRRLEHDFVLAAGADPGYVRMRIAGAEAMNLDSATGDLVLSMASGRTARLECPVSYQLSAGVRQPVASRYVLGADGSVGFALGSYDHRRGLVIDPVLAYSTYLGGSSEDQVRALAVDSSGAVYIAGISTSTDFPMSGAAPFQKSSPPAAHGAASAFVAKIKADGSALLWSTYLGGSGVNLMPTSYSAGSGGGACGVPVSTPSGFSLSCGDLASGIAVDSAGNVYVTGTAYSTDFPLHNPFQKTNRAAAASATNVFVAKLNPTGSALLWSTYLGGSGRAATSSPAIGAGDLAGAIALDANDNVYVTGQSASLDFPLANALQGQNREPATSPYGGQGAATAFVTKIKADGSALEYSTYLGGSDATLLSAADSGVQWYGLGIPGDAAQTIAVDSNGETYVAGITLASDFPTANAIQPVNNAFEFGTANGFVAKFNAAGSTLLWSTYLGGTGNPFGEGDGVMALALDSAANAYLTGYAFSGDFPLLSPYQSRNLAEPFGGANAFVAKIHSNGSALAWSTYLGGPLAVLDGSDSVIGDGGTAIALDKSGNVYVAGFTASQAFPLASALETTNVAAAHGQSNAFVSELNPTGSALLFSTYWGGEGSGRFAASPSSNTLGPLAGDAALAIAVDSNSNLYLGGAAQSPDFPTYKALQPGLRSSAAENGFVAKFAPGSPAQAATELTLSSSNPTALAGARVTFIARVVELASPAVPSGQVSFTVDGKPWGSPVSLSSSGYASQSATSLPVGTHQVIASYTGSAACQTSSAGISQITQYPAPIFSLSAGSATAPQPLSITDQASGAAIYYTLASSPLPPTALSNLYATPLTLPGGSWTLEAIAIDPKGNAGAVASAAYTVTSAPPIIAPATGAYVAGSTVTLSPPPGDPNGVIHYTTDGTPATTSSTSRTLSATAVSMVTLVIPATTTLHAIWISQNCASQPWCPSGQAIATITIAPQLPAPTVAFFYSAAVPNGFQISDATKAAAIYFTTNGATPTPQSTQYASPIALGVGTTTVKALAVLSGDVNSPVATQTFVVSPPSLKALKAVTQPVSGIAPAHALLNGKITSASRYWFEYGASPAALTHKTSEASANPASLSIAVGHPLTGLTHGRRYYFHLVATHGTAISKGAILTFIAK